MNQNLPDIIRGNEDLRQALLEQEGGIVSYLAGHLDADGLEALYKGYRTQYLEAYRDQNKWSMREEVMERGALGDDHIKKELAYQVALRPVLSGFPDVSEPALSFIADYMDYAFKKSHTELYPKNVVIDQKFYEEVIIQYSDKLFGRAHRCLWLVINEHRDKARAEKDVEQLWEEFELRKYARVYTNGVEKLRRAVNELINEKAQNKTKEETRQICREEAKDVMKRLRSFTRLVNGDFDIPGKISKKEMIWLREGMLYMDPLLDSKDNEGMSPLQDCFQHYYHILNTIGDIWVVQLKEYGIDIRELEEETGCIINKSGFYLERSLGGHFGKFVMLPSPINEQDQAGGKQSFNLEQKTTLSHDKQHGIDYYGEDIAIFHENLDPGKIANKIQLLDRKKAGGKKIAARNFILILYNVFSNHPGCMTTMQKTKFVKWVKYNCKIYFEVNHLKNVELDDEEKQKIDLYHAEFANKQPKGKWFFKKEFYQIDPITNVPKKSIDGAW